MLTFERRLLGRLIAEEPEMMQRPQFVVTRMTTSTGAAGADYGTDGFAIAEIAHDAVGVRIYAVCSCDLLLVDGGVSPDTIWAYGDTGKLRGFNVRTAKEVNQTTDVPPGSILRIVLLGS